MINHYIAGREFLEGKKAGLFGESVAFCLEHDGVVHFSPDCLLMGVPCEDAPDTLWIIFQHSHLPALRRVCSILLRIWVQLSKLAYLVKSSKKAIGVFCS